MKNWNELKTSVLKTLRENPALTPRTLAEALKVSEDSMQMALFRYFKMGLVARTRGFNRSRRASYVYTLTARGVARLGFLEKTPS